MDFKLLSLYFLLGGAITALVTYFGGQAKGLLAAFVASFPTITLVTLCTVYLGGGLSAATSYFKGMLLLAPAWLLYIVSVLYLLPRLGFILSLIIGICLYSASALVTMKLVH